MRFLILMKHAVGAPAPDASAFQAAKEYSAALRAAGTLECGYAIVPNGGVWILNVQSHEELWDKMNANPLCRTAECEVYPLLEADYWWDKSIERLQKAVGS